MVPRLSEMQPLDEDLCEGGFPLKSSLKFAHKTESVSLIFLGMIMIIITLQNIHIHHHNPNQYHSQDHNRYISLSRKKIKFMIIVNKL